MVGLLYFTHGLNHFVIAEGIETEEQRQTLQSLGVTLGPGYLLGRPLPALED